MLKHIVDVHGGEHLDKIDFRMKVLEFHKSAFERQISESVRIQNNRAHNILNSKSEFNRCALPRLGLKLGAREFEKENEKNREEEKKEKTIEQIIKEMKKERNAQRPRRKKKESSAPKRRKIENETGECGYKGTYEITENEIGTRRKGQDEKKRK